VDFVATLTLLSRAFEARLSSWAVIGGLALGLRGVPRTTVDVDILVDRAALDPLDHALGDAGYSLEYRWEESSHFLPPPNSRLAPVDALHAHRTHALGMLRTATMVELGAAGPTVPVVLVEDLAGLKLQALCNDPRREAAELADLLALFQAAEATRTTLDLARLEEYFELFDRADLLDALLGEADDADR
jgi:hypothetical protein